MSVDDPKAGSRFDRALKLLTSPQTINPDLVQPGDKGKVIELLEWLRDHSVKYSADDVAAWFKNNRPLWPTERILVYARGVIANRKFRPGAKGPFWRPGYLDEQLK